MKSYLLNLTIQSSFRLKPLPKLMKWFDRENAKKYGLIGFAAVGFAVQLFSCSSLGLYQTHAEIPKSL